MLREREHRPEIEILRPLDQGLDAGDLRIAESLQKLCARLLRIGADALPAVAGANVLDLHQSAHVHLALVGGEEGGEEHAASGEVDGGAFEVDLKVLLDGSEAEGVRDAGVGPFTLWVDVLEAGRGVDAITAHEQISGCGAAVFEFEGDFVLRLFDCGGAFAAGEGDVLVLLHCCQDALQCITAGDTQGLVWWIADAFAFGASEVRLGQFAGVDVEDLEVVDCAAIVVRADDGEGA